MFLSSRCEKQGHVRMAGHIAPVARTAEVLLVWRTLFVRAVAPFLMPTVGEQLLQCAHPVGIFRVNRQILLRHWSLWESHP